MKWTKDIIEEISGFDFLPCYRVERGAKIKLLALHHLQSGKLLKEVADMLISDERSVRSWLRAFIEFDYEGLIEKEGRGKKPHVHHLEDCTVYYIGVFSDLEVMQERKVLRHDRCTGLSNDQINRVHQGVLNSYDFKVDTTAIFPFEAAHRILKFVGDTAVPKAFRVLGKQE